MKQDRSDRLDKSEDSDFLQWFGFAKEFSGKSLRETKDSQRLFAEAEKEVAAAKRVDLRHLNTFTIDPDDAADFDDALSLHQDGDKIVVGVHISDVSHFIRPGTELDREALARGTSVYLPGNTAPMLPPELSDDLCSLKPKEDRLAFSVMFTMQGNNIEQVSFTKSIIRSRRRFAYNEVKPIIGQERGPMARELSLLWQIAKHFRQERQKNGALMFEDREVKCEFGKDGQLNQLAIKERHEAHYLVEEWMIAANREAAIFGQQRSLKEPLKKEFAPSETSRLIYRVHEPPESDRAIALSQFLSSLGHRLPIHRGTFERQDLNRILKTVFGKPEGYLVEQAAVRAMTKAVYTFKNRGHFGLGLSEYTHFTSPIRRYPDILVHRFLGKRLGEVNSKPGRRLFAGRLEPRHNRSASSHQTITGERQAEYLSLREQAAAEAERAALKQKQAEYLKRFIGATRNGIVSGVSQSGIFVEDIATKTSGLVRFGSLPKDYYRIDERHYRVVGRQTKRHYQLGNAVKIKVLAADPITGYVDYEIVSQK